MTAGGGVRDLPLLRRSEDVALVGLHYEGTFFEFVPWNGAVEWTIAPWGSWRVTAQAGAFAVELTATCDPTAGTPLRAPTAERGLAVACRDTFAGRLTVTLWRLDPTGKKELVVRASSSQAALETGGGPWAVPWSARAAMAQPIKTLAGLPVDVGRLLPTWLYPPGL